MEIFAFAAPESQFHSSTAMRESTPCTSPLGRCSTTSSIIGLVVPQSSEIRPGNSKRVCTRLSARLESWVVIEPSSMNLQLVDADSFGLGMVA